MYLLALLFAAAPVLATLVPPGFVSAHDGEFRLDGRPFFYQGTNAYWLPQLTVQADVDTVFEDMQKNGVKVVRTWAFSSINATQASSVGDWLTYYQAWENGTYTINNGSNGLQRLDYVVKSAGDHNIRLILTLTNNWDDYGGSEAYLDNIDPAGTHDAFYTNPQVVAAYQSYVTTIVNRYKTSPNVFAWELMNEARCGGTRPSSANCPPSAGGKILSEWYAAQSAFIKHLDPYHMVTTGGEGQFFITDPTKTCYAQLCVYDYNFNGGPGEDFVGDLSIPTLDFAVYHQYPVAWESYFDHPGSNVTLAQWGIFWEQQHAAAAKKAGKPLVLEEFGYPGYQNKTEIYPSWVETALATNHAGIMPWQWGEVGLAEQGGLSPDDGFTVYTNQSVFQVFVNASKVQDERSC